MWYWVNECISKIPDYFSVIFNFFTKYKMHFENVDFIRNEFLNGNDIFYFDFFSISVAECFLNGICMLVKTLYEIQIKKEKNVELFSSNLSDNFLSPITNENYILYVNNCVLVSKQIISLFSSTIFENYENPFSYIFLSLFSSLITSSSIIVCLSNSSTFHSSSINLSKNSANALSFVFCKSYSNYFSSSSFLSKDLFDSIILPLFKLFYSSTFFCKMLSSSTFIPSSYGSFALNNSPHSPSFSSFLHSYLPFTIHPAISSYFHSLSLFPPLPLRKNNNSSSDFTLFSSNFPSFSLSFIHSFLLFILLLNHLDSSFIQKMNIKKEISEEMNSADLLLSFLLQLLPLFIDFFDFHLTSLYPSPSSLVPSSSSYQFSHSSEKDKVNIQSFLPFLFLCDDRNNILNLSPPVLPNTPSDFSFSSTLLPKFVFYPTRAIRSHRISSIIFQWNTGFVYFIYFIIFL
jgi:hypothetical protein